MASRILGMGDVLSLIEKAQEAIDEKEAEKLAAENVKLAKEAEAKAKAEAYLRDHPELLK